MLSISALSLALKPAASSGAMSRIQNGVGKTSSTLCFIRILHIKCNFAMRTSFISSIYVKILCKAVS